MNRYFRHIVYFLMLTLASNAFGWTFNKDAVDDVWFGEQPSLAADDGNVSSSLEEINASSPEKPCNHWCHAVGHFIGLVGQSVVVMPEFADNHSIQQSPPVQNLSLDGPFRPPRQFLS
jgi:hypothetical protein